MLRRSVIALTAIVLVAGCGSGNASDEFASTVDDQPPAASVEESSGASDGTDTVAGGICDPLLSLDLSAAFGGAFEFGEINEYATGNGCSATLDGAEGEGLLVQLTIAENYALKAEFEEQDFPFTSLDGLGQEAFIVNGADLNVLIDADSSLNVALSAFFSGDVELPEPSIIEAGLVAVAEAVLAGL